MARGFEFGNPGGHLPGSVRQSIEQDCSCGYMGTAAVQNGKPQVVRQGGGISLFAYPAVRNEHLMGIHGPALGRGQRSLQRFLVDQPPYQEVVLGADVVRCRWAW